MRMKKTLFTIQVWKKGFSGFFRFGGRRAAALLLALGVAFSQAGCAGSGAAQSGEALEPRAEEAGTPAPAATETPLPSPAPTEEAARLSAQGPAEWKSVYYDYLKELCRDKFSGGQENPFFTPEFYDVNGDGVPELLLQEYPGGSNGQFYPFLTVREGKVEDFLPADNGGSPLISSVLRDAQTGEYLLLLAQGSMMRGFEEVYYHAREDGSWGEWRYVSCRYDWSGDEMQYNLEESFFREDGQTTRFATQEEAREFFENTRPQREETSGTAEGTELDLSKVTSWEAAELDLSKVTSWEAASPIVISVLNSLDGKDDFPEDAPESDASPVASWKQVYYDYIKKNSADKIGKLYDMGHGYTFCDVDGDGVPEMIFMEGYEGHPAEIYTVRGEAVETLFLDGDGKPGQASGIGRDPDTGEYLLLNEPNYYGAGEENVRTAYHKQKDGWAVYTQSCASFLGEDDGTGKRDYDLSRCYAVKNGETIRFATQQEARDYFAGESRIFDGGGQDEGVKYLPLNQAENWEEASRLVVDCLNSLDGKEDFTGQPGEAGGTGLTDAEQKTIYELYVRYIVKILHDHGSADGHQMASMAVAMDKAERYLREEKSRTDPALPGVSFQKSVSLEDLNRLLKEVYGEQAPVLDAGDFPAGAYRTAGKDPTAKTFGGLGSYLVYAPDLGRVLVGESELAKGSKALDMIEEVRRKAEETGVVRVYLDLVTYIICRGNYRDGGFYAAPDGGVYAVLDNYGETVIAREEYEKILTTTDYQELCRLVKELRDKYKLRGAESSLLLEGDLSHPEKMTVGTAESGGGSPSAGEEPLDEQETLSGASKAYYRYYLSFLKAINALDGSLTAHCTENQRARQEERIFKFNKDYTFQNRNLYIDRDSVTVGYENGLPTVKFNARCENDMWEREKSGASAEKNVALSEVIVQKEGGEWTVVYTRINNAMAFGENRINLAE